LLEGIADDEDCRMTQELGAKDLLALDLVTKNLRIKAALLLVHGFYFIQQPA
jgi:hypothetical protein